MENGVTSDEAYFITLLERRETYKEMCRRKLCEITGTYKLWRNEKHFFKHHLDVAEVSVFYFLQWPWARKGPRCSDLSLSQWHRGQMTLRHSPHSHLLRKKQR